MEREDWRVVARELQHWMEDINDHYGQINNINFDPGLATEAARWRERLFNLLAPPAPSQSVERVPITVVPSSFGDSSYSTPRRCTLCWGEEHGSMSCEAARPQETPEAAPASVEAAWRVFVARWSDLSNDLIFERELFELAELIREEARAPLEAELEALYRERDALATPFRAGGQYDQMQMRAEAAEAQVSALRADVLEVAEWVTQVMGTGLYAEKISKRLRALSGASQDGETG